MKKHIVDNAVNTQIQNRLDELKKEVKLNSRSKKSASDNSSKISSLRSELDKLKQQKNKIYNLYEREIYDDETFNARISEVKKRETEINEIIKISQKEEIAVDKSEALSVMSMTVKALSEDIPAYEKSELLHKIIKRIECVKTDDNCTIDITFCV